MLKKPPADYNDKIGKLRKIYSFREAQEKVSKITGGRSKGRSWLEIATFLKDNVEEADVFPLEAYNYLQATDSFKTHLDMVIFLLLNNDDYKFDKALGIRKIHYVSREEIGDWRRKMLKMLHPDKIKSRGLNIDSVVLNNASKVVISMYSRMLGR